MSLSDRLQQAGAKFPKKRTEPLWKGPESDDPNGGVTFSMISRFLCCRERFRITVIEGLRPVDQFSHKRDYGSMWHTCEEWLAKGNDPTRGGRSDRLRPLWEDALKNHAQALARLYPMQAEQVEHWYSVCLNQFPLYVEYWSKNQDVIDRTPLLQEQNFNIPYTLPSGRVVRLRGRWDSVDLIGRGKGAGIYLQENKTKGDIYEDKLKRQLLFDLQSMIYIVALTVDDSRGVARTDMINMIKEDSLRFKVANAKVQGIRYNVIRRPLSGGKGSIVRHKPTKSNPQGESKESFYQRVAEYIREEPQHYFMRWKVEILPEDVARFRRECLDPLLEQICEWYDYIAGNPGLDPFQASVGIHWRYPFGVYNTVLEGGETDLDEYLLNGSEVGLHRVDELFTELK